ncbi:MAG: rhodanese-like domain-containing protein [Promethearchaeota archaeon]
MRLQNSKDFLIIYVMFIFLSIFLIIPIPAIRAQSYISINVETANDMINNSNQYPNLVILDVREQWEYNENHLCDSVLIPLSEINVRISELLPYKDIDIIVYCRSGSRSAQASQNLVDNHNFTKIYNMLGGINAWIVAGYEVCDGQTQPSINFLDETFLLVFLATTILIIFLFITKGIVKIQT